MQLATIDVSPDEAKVKLAEYRRVLKEERTSEDIALAQAYRAIDRGLTVIRLSEVINAGGAFDNGLPRIAVVRADATECFVTIDEPWRTNGARAFVFGTERWADNRGALVGRSTVRVATSIPRAPGSPAGGGRTTVPLIPPQHRPRRARLRGLHILWEVEAWDPTPPKDPALIKHLRGDLWSVLAVWDLTELERAVLSQRLT